MSSEKLRIRRKFDENCFAINGNDLIILLNIETSNKESGNERFGWRDSSVAEIFEFGEEDDLRV